MLVNYIENKKILFNVSYGMYNVMSEMYIFFSAGHMLDLLRVQGHNGAMALLESLMIHYPALYTRITGRQPSIEPSGFSGQSVHFYPIDSDHAL